MRGRRPFCRSCSEQSRSPAPSRGSGPENSRRIARKIAFVETLLATSSHHEEERCSRATFPRASDCFSCSTDLHKGAPLPARLRATAEKTHIRCRCRPPCHTVPAANRPFAHLLPDRDRKAAE